MKLKRNLNSFLIALGTITIVGGAHAQEVKTCLNNKPHVFHTAPGVDLDISPLANLYIGECSKENYERNLRGRAIEIQFCQDNPQDCDGLVADYDERLQESAINLSEWNPSQGRVKQIIAFLRNKDEANHD